MPQLDGLRAVAVACVLAFHFIPGVDRYAPLGAMGVRLFFVISGFLITGILLSWRGQPLGLALKTFYLRRALRIFPLFYFVLAAAAVLNIGPVRDTLFWHVTYLSNFYFYLRGDWHGSVSHLWSLAVEEQFYLVWPWLVLCAPKRWLRPAIVTMIALAPLSRLLWPHPMDSVLPTSCLDSLGLGALLALSVATAAPHKGAPYRSSEWALYVGATLAAITLNLRYEGIGGQYQIVGLDFGVSLLSMWLVAGASREFTGTAGRLLSWPLLMSVGRISYGLYVYHGFTPYLLGRYVPGFMSMAAPTRVAMLFTVTAVIAMASWRWLEQPFLRLKSHPRHLRHSRHPRHPNSLASPTS
jgi:peptidoglycan/LPS O-acetylase OafA/YrhL